VAQVDSLGTLEGLVKSFTVRLAFPKEGVCLLTGKSAQC